MNLKVSDLEASVNKWKSDCGILSGLFSDLNAEYDKLVKENKQMMSHFNSEEYEWNTHHSNDLSLIELKNELNVEKNHSQDLENRLNKSEAGVQNALMARMIIRPLI